MSRRKGNPAKGQKKLRRCASDVQKARRREKTRKNKIRKLSRVLADNPNCQNTKRKLKEMKNGS